jgi:hypothetical protein
MGPLVCTVFGDVLMIVPLVGTENGFEIVKLCA